MTGFYLRYRRDIPDGTKFSTIRYPAHHAVALERAEQMRDAMPDPSRFEIVEETT